MTIDEMKQKKKEYGCSYEYIAKLSGVPVSTIQKIFGGTTSTPRRTTLEALSKAFMHMSMYALADGGSERKTDGTSALNLSFENKTVSDYLALPDDVRVELIDGVFYDMAGPAFDHQFIAASIYTVFRNHIDDNNGSCIPIIAPFDVQLDRDDKTMVQPDVMIVCDRAKITRPKLYGEPDLIVEVLSPSNWYNDMVRKLRKYKNAGVREYWIVIPDHKKVLVYEFEKSSDPVEYTFNDLVPVGIWNGACKVDFSKISEKITFLPDE